MAISFRSAQSAQVTATAVTTLNVVITKPVGLTSGDLLFAWIIAGSAGGDPVTITSLDGFTQLGTTAGVVANGVNGALWWKLAGPSEPSTYTFTCTWGSLITTDCGGLVCAYSGQDQSSSNGMDGVSNPATDGTGSTSVVCSSVSPSRAGDMLLAFLITRCSGSQQTATAPGGMTLRIDQPVHSASPSFRQVAYAEQLLSGAGATGTRTYTVSLSTLDSVVATVAIQAVATGGIPQLALLGVG